MSLDLTDEEIWQQRGLNVPLLSSDRASWQGLQFAYHRQPPHEIPIHRHAHHVIAVCLQPYVVQFECEGRWQTEVYTCGDAVIFPAEQESPLARCEQTVEYLNLFLEPAVLSQVASELTDGQNVELPSHWNVHDPFIYQLSLALKTELEWGGCDSGFYADSMATALSAHLIRRYSRQRSPIESYRDGLPPHLLRQAIAYIQEHLDQDLRLADIAAAVHLSSHYFASLVKQSVGLAPHQYVTQCRMERAKQLLAKPELTITEILGRIGLKSQSHFTRLFRQYTSVTPKAYRDRL